jgi:asparagine synthetase B (glutamine-hydrolysing)
MSGLFGYYDPSGAIPEGAFARMAAVLRQDSLLREASACESFGAIGALVRGSFPGTARVLASADGARQVLLQGAVLAIRGEEESADVERFARRLFCESLDESLLARAVGSFVAVILDRNAQTLEVVTDPNGSYPLYVAQVDDAVLFAGQQKALIATRKVVPRLDPLGAAMMLQLGWLGGETTLLEGVRLLPPGTYLRAGPSGVSQTRYFTQFFQADTQRDWDAELEHMGALLTRAVERTHRAATRIGVPVSGGLDSRTILSLSPDREHVPSFTFGNRGCRDIRFGAAIARALGSPHVSLVTDPSYLERELRLGVWLTEGEMGATHFHFLPYVEEIARHCEVVLDGIAGGNLFGGTYVNGRMLTAERQAASPENVFARVDQLPGGILPMLGSPRLPGSAFEQARKWFIEALSRSPGASAADRTMAFLHEHRTRRFSGGGPRLLRWRLDVEAPFYDSELIAEVVRLPHRWRRRDRFYAALVRKIAPVAARVRWTHSGVPLAWPFALNWSAMAAQRLATLFVEGPRRPPLVRHRDLHDFPGWMRGPLRPLVERTLLSTRALDRRLIPPDLQRRLVRDHMNGEDRSPFLGVLMSLEVFCQDFLDDFEAASTHWSRSERMRRSPFHR